MTTPDVDQCEVQSTCSICGATEGQNKEHTWVEANCTTPKTCSTCQKTDGTKLGHTPNEDDGDCTTAVLCSVCNTVTTEAKSAHTPDEDDGDCTTAIVCLACNTVMTEAKSAHINEDDDIVCDNCTCYLIYTAEDLYEWREDSTYPCAVLLADIVLPEELIFDLDGDSVNDSNWKPASIGSIFYGNGHSITGAIIINPGVDSIGFFGNVFKNSVVRDLTLIDVEIIGKFRVGGIAGNNHGMIINSSVSGSISSKSGDAGGIAGLSGGTVIGCCNEASVNGGTGSAAGIVGQHTSSGKGIFGCYNLGEISTTGNTAGGIVANYYADIGLYACYSAGTVTSNMNNGGIAGYADLDSVLNCFFGGNAKVTDGTTLVDGETVTWADALASMNTTLNEKGIMWRYELNGGDDRETRPLVLVEYVEST